MLSLKLRSLAKRLNQIESKVGPVDAEYAAFLVSRAKFLALLADDPFYNLVIEPEFRLTQMRLFAERGATLRDVTPPPGVATVRMKRGATMDVPDGESWDGIWLALDPRAAPIRDALDQTEAYLADVWAQAQGATGHRDPAAELRTVVPKPERITS